MMPMFNPALVKLKKSQAPVAAVASDAQESTNNAVAQMPVFNPALIKLKKSQQPTSAAAPAATQPAQAEVNFADLRNRSRKVEVPRSSSNRNVQQPAQQQDQQQQQQDQQQQQQPQVQNQEQLQSCPVAKALFDFKARNENELDFMEGNEIAILKQQNEWWRGQNLKSRHLGWFPANHVELIPDRTTMLPAEPTGVEHTQSREEDEVMTDEEEGGQGKLKLSTKNVSPSISELQAKLKTSKQSPKSLLFDQDDDNSDEA